MHEYSAIVTKICTCDTVEVKINLGFDVITKQIIQLNGIRTPNLVRKDRQLQLICIQKLEKLLLNKEVIIKTYLNNACYDTVVYSGDVYISSKKTKSKLINVTDWLLEENLATYSYCDNIV